MTKLKYKLVKRKLNFGAQKGKVVYIAQPVNLGKIGFDDLVKEVSDGSTVDAAARQKRDNNLGLRRRHVPTRSKACRR